MEHGAQNLVAQDMAAGRGAIVVESKGDLVSSLCDLVPAERLDDAIVFDPADPKPLGTSTQTASPTYNSSGWIPPTRR